MESPNIKHVPLNRQGCLELGICPCSICDVGYASNTTTYIGYTTANPSNNKTSDIKNTSCIDTCEYIKIFYDKETLQLLSLRK